MGYITDDVSTNLGQQWPVILTVISGVETADVTDAANPLIHLLLCVSDQVEDPVDGLDVEYEAMLQILLVERQPSIHLQAEQTWFNTYRQKK